MSKNIFQCIWCIAFAAFDLVNLVKGNGNAWVMGILTILMTVCASYWIIEIRDEFIKEYANRDPEKTAVSDSFQKISYGELDIRSRALAGRLTKKTFLLGALLYKMPSCFFRIFCYNNKCQGEMGCAHVSCGANHRKKING